MKKYISKILLFFSIVVVVDFCFGIFGDYLQVHAKSGDTRFVNDLVTKDCHDVLILGSSRARHHYDAPMLSDSLSMDVCNAGFDGNGVILAYGLLKMMIDRCHPKLVLYDVEPTFDIQIYPSDHHGTRYLKFLKPYYKKPGIEEVFRDVSDEEWYKVQSGLIRYNGELISKISDNIKVEPSVKRGYEPLKGMMNKNIKEEPSPIPTPTPELDGLKLRHIEKIIDLAQSKNIPIALICSPKYGAKSSVIFQSVKEICRKNGVTFFDYYTDSYFLERSDLFKDPMHLNEVGAREYSKRVLVDMKSLLIGE